VIDKEGKKTETENLIRKRITDKGEHMRSENRLFLSVMAGTMVTVALFLQIAELISANFHIMPVRAATMIGYTVAAMIYTVLAARYSRKFVTRAVVCGFCATLSMCTYLNLYC
jgi:uncharacterized membrane protein